jgi:flagellar protein FliS
MGITGEATTQAMKKYNRVKIETSDQLSLITLLYDGIIRFLNGAVVKMRSGKSGHFECVKARNIIQHLIDTLNMEAGEVAENLMRLYLFIYREIVTADMENSVTMIEEILPVVDELRTGWKEMKRKEGKRIDG